ncbi:MAG: CAP domain-containing protein, partial [Vulcanimicrobiota bacterium]
VKRGMTPYLAEEVLARAARTHSQNMARFNFFDHVSPVKGQAEVSDRVVAAGGRDGNLGENLYWCSGLPEARIGGSVIAEWLSSPDHRDTVLSTEYTRAGVGAFHRGKEYWVTLVCQD